MVPSAPPLDPLLNSSVALHVFSAIFIGIFLIYINALDFGLIASLI